MQVKVLFTENILTSFILKQLSFPHISVGKESACNAGDPSLIPGSGKNAGEGIGYPLQYSWASLVAQLVKESACNEGDLGSISGLGRSPGEGTGYPFQYSTLENSMDCIVHGIAKSQMWLSNFQLLKQLLTFPNWCGYRQIHKDKQAAVLKCSLGLYPPPQEPSSLYFLPLGNAPSLCVFISNIGMLQPIEMSNNNRRQK